MEDQPQSRTEIRRDMRSRRHALPRTAQQDAATEVARLLASLPQWQRAKRVAVYHANDGEIDLTPVVNALRAGGKSPYLPVIQADRSLLFALWESGQRLHPNQFGIPEPRGKQYPASEMDIILLPLVAWDQQGNRLGMGGGFYDRTLADVAEVLKVGMAYECQRVDALPEQTWDVRLDIVATEGALYRCQRDN